MTGPAVPPGGDELREAIAEVLRRRLSDGSPDYWPDLEDWARDVVALPAVRDALAARETLRRVEALAEEWATSSDLHNRAGNHLRAHFADRLRRALDGEP